MQQVREYTVVLEPDDAGWIVVEVPALPGCVTQGRTRDEALANAHEAIGLYLEALEAEGQTPPQDKVEIVRLAV
ncbi:MAG: hypothetical protein AMXMBFR23_12540 [Chloroflexota bacterium]